MGGAPVCAGWSDTERPTLNIEHRTSNVERGMRGQRKGHGHAERSRGISWLQVKREIRGGSGSIKCIRSSVASKCVGMPLLFTLTRIHLVATLSRIPLVGHLLEGDREQDRVMPSGVCSVVLIWTAAAERSVDAALAWMRVVGCLHPKRCRRPLSLRDRGLCHRTPNSL